MAKQDEHGRIIAAAAKATLLPIGCRRIGQSRCWISDERYWIIFIEFQPSGWAKGSYLNVGASWLWHARKGLAFNVGYRVADFIRFESTEQFTPLIGDMAAVAAREVVKLREKFKSFAEIHYYLINHLSEGWPVYHAAVAAGLAGDIETSSRLFVQFDAWCNSYHRKAILQSESTSLASILAQPAQFRAAVQTIIEKCRALNGLPRDPNCLDVVASTIAH
jgi:hypothetical protein